VSVSSNNAVITSTESVASAATEETIQWVGLGWVGLGLGFGLGF
jgi:hypothetical protein